MALLRRFAPALAALFTIACSSGGARDGFGLRDMEMAPLADLTLPPPPDLAPSYPPGPYGNMEGDTLADIALEGYRLTPAITDSSQLTYDTTIRLSDFHSNPACKCLLITVSAGWCGPCQEEQPTIIADVNGDPSFCVLNVLLEGQSDTVLATKADVYTWTQQFMQDFYVVRGTQPLANEIEDGYGQTIGLPFNLIVQPSTMQVLMSIQGYDPMIHDDAMALCNSN